MTPQDENIKRDKSDADSNDRDPSAMVEASRFEEKVPQVGSDESPQDPTAFTKNFAPGCAGGLEATESPSTATFPADTTKDVDSGSIAPKDSIITETISKAPSQPLHSVFSKHWKIFIIVMSAIGAFLSPISANLYFPALNTLQAYYSVSAADINLTLTSYMVFQAIAPAFMGDFADQSGHRPAFILCTAIYLGANIGLALQDSFAALIVLRCMQSAGASGTIALRNGVIAEVITPAERGVYLGLMQAGTLIAPTLGPVIGGVLTETLGWRSTFWFLVIFCGAYLVPYVIFMPETNRKVVGNGSIAPNNWWNKSVLDFARSRRAHHADQEANFEKPQATLLRTKLRWPKPWRTLILMTEKDVAMIIAYSALLYAAMYAVITSIPILFGHIYNFNDIQIGLCYIPIGIGCAIGALGNGKLLNHTYARIARENGFSSDTKRKHDLRRFPIEKARLQAVLPCVACTIVLTIAYGWVLDAKTNLAGPLILQFFMGIVVIAAFSSLGNLLVDIFPESPSTVTAASNLGRCLCGAAASALINPMLSALGVGWSYTLISLILAVLSPMLLIELRMGPKWREARHVRLEEKRAVAVESRNKEKTDQGE